MVLPVHRTAAGNISEIAVGTSAATGANMIPYKASERATSRGLGCHHHFQDGVTENDKSNGTGGHHWLAADFIRDMSHNRDQDHCDRNSQCDV